MSLKRFGVCGEYAKVVYQTLPVMMEELLSEEKQRLRFTRFRAQTRAIDGLTKGVAYGAEKGQLPKSQLRGKDERRLKQELFAKKRAVFFGYAQFGHGPRGPCPRTKLVRAVALRCPVVFVDEYCTYTCCKGCGFVLKGSYGSRVLRCENNHAGPGPCPADEIGRDTNSAAKIGT